jgi:hypothetical protein
MQVTLAGTGVTPGVPVGEFGVHCEYPSDMKNKQVAKAKRTLFMTLMIFGFLRGGEFINKLIEIG